MLTRTIHAASVLSLTIGLVCCGSHSGEDVDSGSNDIKAADVQVAGDPGGGPLSCNSDTACFDVTTNGANITHIFIDSPCVSGDGDYEVTVDGEPVKKLHTNGGPCQSIPRDVWFPLQGNQAEAHVCVTVKGVGPSGVQVGAKAKNDCVMASVPLNCGSCPGTSTGANMTSTGATMATTGSSMTTGGAGGASTTGGAGGATGTGTMTTNGAGGSTASAGGSGTCELCSLDLPCSSGFTCVAGCCQPNLQ
jgi:hypothetical protein